MDAQVGDAAADRAHVETEGHTPQELTFSGAARSLARAARDGRVTRHEAEVALGQLGLELAGSPIETPAPTWYRRLKTLAAAGVDVGQVLDVARSTRRGRPLQTRQGFVS